MQAGAERKYDIVSGSDAKFNQCLQQAGNGTGYVTVVLASKEIQIGGLVNSCTMPGDAAFFMCTRMYGPEDLMHLENTLVNIISSASNLNQLRDGQVGDINLTGKGGSVLLRSRPN